LREIGDTPHIMKTTKFTLRYGEKRSANFQSIDVSAEVEIELEEGDDLERAHNEALRAMVKRVRDSADRAIERYQTK
jgi:hypothetical protein